MIWHEMLPYALMAYHTSTGAMPYSLVYGMEAILPVEVEILNLQILVESKLDKAEWVKTRFEQLNLIEGQRLKAVRHCQAN